MSTEKRDIQFRIITAEVPESLYGRVLSRIDLARMRAARVRITISTLGMSASLVGSILAIRATLTAANASGFTSLTSLTITDTSTVAAHAQSFILSLLETLPGVQVAAVLFGISVLLVSLRALVTALARPAGVHSPIVHA